MLLFLHPHNWRFIMKKLGYVCLFSFCSLALGFVKDTNARNEAVIVNSLHGLPGGKGNIVHMQEITSNPAYKFHDTVLSESAATSRSVFSQLTQAASRVDQGGTLLFYFGGHGGNQLILVHDRNVQTRELRAAIEAGRKDLGPLERLVMIFDGCYSGSHVDPIVKLAFGRLNIVEPLTAETIAEEFGGERGSAYWKSVIVMASAMPHETSWVGQNGHMFTTAMNKAFKESTAENSTLGEFAKLSAKYLSASHAVAKMVPADLVNEKILP
jgi:hypothetical protein